MSPAPTIRIATLALVLAACGGSTRGTTTPDPDVVGRPLAGPYPTLTAAVAALGDDAAPAAIELAATRTDDAVVALIDLTAHDGAASSCAVAVTTAAGVFLGPSFLCWADRSDERIETRASAAPAGVALMIETTVRTVAEDGQVGPATTIAHRVVCDLGGQIPTCSPPPAIGGHDYGCVDDGPAGYCPAPAP